ncbi:hypothetical protein D9M68_949640 [compost metagenome]
MAGRVARHVDDREAQPEHLGAVAIRQRLEGLRNAFARRAEDRRAGGRMERGHAASVIGMMVRD